MKFLTIEKAALACFAIALILFVAMSAPSAFADAAAPSVDDFNDPAVSTYGLPRLIVTDNSVGGQSTLEHVIENGAFAASGSITPPRGQPGWASTVLLLDGEGEAVDASGYEGIRLRIRVTEGKISISANSTEVTNFDYHAAPVNRQAGEGFQELRIPFNTMKRAWSEQTPLDPSTLASISLVAYDLQPGAFAYEVDEVGFY